MVGDHQGLKPGSVAAGSPQAPSFVQTIAFPDIVGDERATCQGCGTIEKVSNLSSKYGKAQLVGHIRDLRLWEAKCLNCDGKANSGKPKSGMQAIWRETR
jgi:hypothetical protein